MGNPEDSTVVNLMQISSVPVLTSDGAIATHKDPVLSKVLVYLRRGWPERFQRDSKLISTNATNSR